MYSGTPELEVRGLCSRRTFVYDLRVPRPPLAKWFPLKLRISPHGGDGKYQCQQPVPDSFRKPAGPPPTDSREPLACSPLPPGGESEDPCSLPTARRPVETLHHLHHLTPSLWLVLLPRAQLSLPPLPSVFKLSPTRAFPTRPRRSWSVAEVPQVLVAMSALLSLSFSPTHAPCGDLSPQSHVHVTQHQLC